MQGTLCPTFFEHTIANTYSIKRFMDRFSDFGFKKRFAEGFCKEALVLDSTLVWNARMYTWLA
jgi:hypothetical protein